MSMDIDTEFSKTLLATLLGSQETSWHSLMVGLEEQQHATHTGTLACFWVVLSSSSRVGWTMDASLWPLAPLLDVLQQPNSKQCCLQKFQSLPVNYVSLKKQHILSKKQPNLWALSMLLPPGFQHHTTHFHTSWTLWSRFSALRCCRPGTLQQHFWIWSKWRDGIRSCRLEKLTKYQSDLLSTNWSKPQRIATLQNQADQTNCTY